MLSVFTKNLIINHLLRNVAYAPPATLYVVLLTSPTGLVNNSGVTGEVAAGIGYSRQAITLAAATLGESSNSNNINFGTATAGWGTVAYIAIVDHASNVNWGVDVNVLHFEALTEGKNIVVGDTVNLFAGQADLIIS